MDGSAISSFLAAALRQAAPLTLAGVGVAYAEKAGILNIGEESIMLSGAFFGFMAAYASGSLAVGLLVSFLTAGLCGLLFAVLTVSFQANQNVTGLTITTFGLGLYFFVGKGIGEDWPAMAGVPALMKGFAAVEIPALSRIPLLGKAFFSQNSFYTTAANRMSRHVFPYAITDEEVIRLCLR